MSFEKTIEALKEFCTQSSGDALGQIWQGNKATYRWNTGKIGKSGELNGVVRKLAGIDAVGHHIWVVAGSFKIGSNGEILRFTGLPKKFQQQVLSKVVCTIDTSVTDSIKI